MPSSPVPAKTAWSSLFILIVLASLLLTACATPTPSPQDTSTRTVTPSATRAATLPAVRPPRISYPPLQLTPIRPTQPPLTGIDLLTEVKTLLLIGTDSLTPFPGRSDAIALIFYHPRLGRASFLSI